MCWVTPDRAIALADVIGDKSRVAAWRRTREEIFETVVREGWSDQAAAVPAYVGTDALDASAPMLPIVGFLPASAPKALAPPDPKVLATIDGIEERPTAEPGLVYRYRPNNGGDRLAGEEGTFLLCTFW